MKEITGNIESIRAIEDCIRATKKYTEGIFTIRQQHPIQGNSFPSKAFRKYYEVYPKMDVPDWDTLIGKAIDWFETPTIEVTFYYDYRIDRATMYIEEKKFAELKKVVPNLGKAIKAVVPCNNRVVVMANNRRVPVKHQA